MISDMVYDPWVELAEFQKSHRDSINISVVCSMSPNGMIYNILLEYKGHQADCNFFPGVKWFNEALAVAIERLQDKLDEEADGKIIRLDEHRTGEENVNQTDQR